MNSTRDTREIRPLIGGHADERAYRATWNRALLARDNWLNRQHKREAEQAAKVKP